MSQKIYCIAMFQPKAGKNNELFKVLQALEPNSQNEEGCIQYLVTRHIDNDFAQGTSYPIVFNEIWRDKAAFEAHCQRPEIVHFFQTQCVAEDGLVAAHNVCVYSDQPEQIETPVL